MKTVSQERIMRAQRALFEALGQLAIVERMVRGAEEPGAFGMEARPVTIEMENARYHDDRISVLEQLRRLSDRLEVIDERLETLKKGTADGRTD